MRTERPERLATENSTKSLIKQLAIKDQQYNRLMKLYRNQQDLYKGLLDIFIDHIKRQSK